MHRRAVLGLLRAQGDRVLAFGCLGGGGLLVFLAYWRLSAKADPAQGMAYLASGGIGGLFLIGLGATLVVSADLRDSWRKLRLLEHSATGDTGAPLARSAGHLGGREFPASGFTRGAAGFGLGAGLAILVFGWNHIATDGTAGEAYEGLAVAAAGVLVAGLVAGCFIVVMRKAVEDRAAALLAPWLPSTAVPVADHRLAPGGRVLVAEGLRRYHSEGCLAVAGVATESVEVTAVPAGLVPCLLCQEVSV